MTAKKNQEPEVAVNVTKGDGQPVAGVPEEVAAAPAPKATVKAPAVTSVTVTFLDHQGKETSRTFSKEVHGDDFLKIADEFKATNASRLVA